MIVTRLVLRSRNMRDAFPLYKSDGLYKTIITILVESYGMFTVSYALYLGSFAAGNRATNIFFPIFVGTQVCSVFIPP